MRTRLDSHRITKLLSLLLNGGVVIAKSWLVWTICKWMLTHWRFYLLLPVLSNRFGFSVTENRPSHGLLFVLIIGHVQRPVLILLQLLLDFGPFPVTNQLLEQQILWSIVVIQHRLMAVSICAWIAIINQLVIVFSESHLLAAWWRTSRLFTYI